MNIIFTLLERDWIEFKKSFVSIFSFWVILPVMLHVSFALPLSRFILLDVNYLYWSSAAIWIVSSSISAMITTMSCLFRYSVESKQIDAILQSPITNLQLLLSILIKGIVYGTFQFFFSIIITTTLNHEYFTISQLLLILLQIIIIIIFFASLGILFGLMLSNGNTLIQISFIAFILLSLGMGNFIPLTYYPLDYINIIDKIPLVYIFNNIQGVIINEPISWISYFLTIVAIILILLISLIMSYKIFRKI